MSTVRPFFKLVSADDEASRVSSPKEPIVLTGPPENLVGHIVLRNDSSDHLRVRNLRVVPDPKEKATLRFAEPLGVGAKLGPETESRHEVSLSLEPTVPPGQYSARLRVGDSERPLEILVHPRHDVRLSPNHLHFIGVEAGRRHEAQLLLVNRGNVPVQVPPVMATTALDVDTVCRNLTWAVRRKGGEGATATLDAFVEGLRNDMAGWLEFKVSEGNEIVESGDSLLLHLTVRLPNDINKDYRYKGSFRLLGRQVGYSVVPEPVKRRRRPAAKKSTTKKPSASTKKKR